MALCSSKNIIVSLSILSVASNNNRIIKGCCLGKNDLVGVLLGYRRTYHLLRHLHWCLDWLPLLRHDEVRIHLRRPSRQIGQNETREVLQKVGLEHNFVVLLDCSLIYCFVIPPFINSPPTHHSTTVSHLFRSITTSIVNIECFDFAY